MFSDVGAKVKGVAIVTMALGVIGSVISGIGMMRNSFFLAVILIAVGILVSWLGSLLVFAFGELVENSAIIASNISSLTYMQEKQSKPKSTTAAKPAGQDYQAMPAWKRVELEKQQKSADSE